MSFVCGNSHDAAVTLWARLSTQIDGFATAIRLTVLEFNSLGEYGETLFLCNSMLLMHKITEFIADTSNPTVVFLGNPQEIENITGSVITDFPGNRLRMLWYPFGNGVSWTNFTIPANTVLGGTGITDGGNVPGAMNVANGGNIPNPHNSTLREATTHQFVGSKTPNVFPVPTHAPMCPTHLSSPTTANVPGPVPPLSRKRKVLGNALQGSQPGCGGVDSDVTPKPKKLKSANPKPMNSFFLFRQDYTKREGSQHQRVVSGEASKIWKSMSEEQKEPWKQQARDLSEKWKEIGLGSNLSTSSNPAPTAQAAVGVPQGQQSQVHDYEISGQFMQQAQNLQPYALQQQPIQTQHKQQVPQIHSEYSYPVQDVQAYQSQLPEASCDPFSHSQEHQNAPKPHTQHNEVEQVQNGQSSQSPDELYLDTPLISHDQLNGVHQPQDGGVAQGQTYQEDIDPFDDEIDAYLARIINGQSDD
ncbi:hypothetical protein F4803DRAFT_577908 [Xylaria telfairii]|nr:hypothetical protein F4803DRAFT_577908 [Xylaria telfairii]